MSAERERCLTFPSGIIPDAPVRRREEGLAFGVRLGHSDRELRQVVAGVRLRYKECHLWVFPTVRRGRVRGKGRGFAGGVIFSSQTPIEKGLWVRASRAAGTLERVLFYRESNMAFVRCSP